MKRTVVLFIFLISAIVLFAQNNAKSRKELRAEKNARITARVDSLIQSRNYTITAHSAQPLGWQQVQLTSIYDLSVKNDSVKVYLPYYGRAYVADFSSTDGGIKLDTKMENYKVKNRRGNKIVSFKVSAKSDIYEFKLTVTSSGYATIFVNSNRKQAINFSGVLEKVH